MEIQLLRRAILAIAIVATLLLVVDWGKLKPVVYDDRGKMELLLTEKHRVIIITSAYSTNTIDISKSLGPFEKSVFIQVKGEISYANEFDK